MVLHTRIENRLPVITGEVPLLLVEYDMLNSLDGSVMKNAKRVNNMHFLLSYSETCFKNTNEQKILYIIP